MTAATIVRVRAEATGSLEPIFLLESTELTEPA
jgi:hypothetical protein